MGDPGMEGADGRYSGIYVGWEQVKRGLGAGREAGIVPKYTFSYGFSGVNTGVWNYHKRFPASFRGSLWLVFPLFLWKNKP